ncbi:hypothetical protein D3C75_463990 [compost metagenome]
MSELAQLQQAFARGLLGEDDAILAQIHSSFLPAESVLRVYRNHFISCASSAPSPP